MKATKIAVTVVLSVLFILATFSSTALAIIGNYQPDDTPYVCVVVLFSDAARQLPIGYCTGFLISKDFVLTAGHSCMVAATASVCFDKGPLSYTLDEEGKIVSYSTSWTIYNGTPIAYPEYNLSILMGTNYGNHIFSTSDVGLIHLDTPAEGITLAKLPDEAGLADTLPAQSYLRVVGYGVQYQLTPKRAGVYESWVGTISCNSAQVQLSPANYDGSDKYLRCTANSAKNRGGIAFGDSGGPVLYTIDGKEYVLAINSYANNANCVGVSYHCRIDTAGVLSWIKGILETAV